MTTPLQPPKTVKEAKSLKDSLLTGYFNVIRPVGRQKNKRGNLANDLIEVGKRVKKKRGVKPKKPTTTDGKPPPAPNGTEIKEPDEAPKLKARRTNWSLPENVPKLKKAVSDWDNDIGDAVDSNGEKRSLAAFSNTVGIPYNTFKQYVGKDKNIAGTLPYP
jgi:hypothetical protein